LLPLHVPFWGMGDDGGKAWADKIKMNNKSDFVWRQ